MDHAFQQFSYEIVSELLAAAHESAALHVAHGLVAIDFDHNAIRIQSLAQGFLARLSRRSDLVDVAADSEEISPSRGKSLEHSLEIAVAIRI